MFDAPRRLFALCALIAVSLSLAACGSSDSKANNDYVGEVNAIQNQVASEFRTAGSALTATSTPESFRLALDQFDRSVTTATTKLKAVKAPSKVKTLHAQLVGAVAGYHATIASARTVLKAKTTTALAKAQTTFSAGTAQSSSQITTTINAINSKLRR